MADENIKQQSTLSKVVPLSWAEPGPAVFANVAYAQYDGKSVYITFCQAIPPAILGQTDEEKLQQLDKVESIVAAPVIRLVMAPENFRAVAETFQKHLALVVKQE